MTVMLLGVAVFIVICILVNRAYERAAEAARERAMDWYTHVLHYPDRYIGHRLDDMHGCLDQQTGRYEFVFVEDDSQEKYFLKLIGGAKYQRACQNDIVTMSGRIVGLKELQELRNMKGTYDLPHLEVFYLNVENEPQVQQPSSSPQLHPSS